MSFSNAKPETKNLKQRKPETFFKPETKNPEFSSQT